MRKESSASKIVLSGFDDLFGRTENMADEGLLREVALDELFEFAGHPFKARDDERFQEMVESIREHGVLVPGIVRCRAQGGYEIIAGHTRKRACEAAGLKTMPVFVRNMSDDEATIAMIDSNIQREDVLPSEKAKAYKMKYEAIKHQGKKGNSLNAIAADSGESGKMIQRYIWLSRLSENLLDMVDEKRLGVSHGVDLSFLSAIQQEEVYDVLCRLHTGMSVIQSSRLKQYAAEGSLTEAKIWEILAPADRKARKVTFGSRRLDQYFPDSYSEKEIEEIIISLLEQWKQEADDTRG